MTAPQDDSDLDPGLWAAFHKPQTQANHSKGPPPSILDTLARKTGSSLRVHLHDVDEGNTPIVEVLARSSAGQQIGSSRYQVLGEIARGGVGVIYKGRDVDLGRDVAMKVLHEKLKDRPDILHRFVEEAQIGGQLQHPGIVPVYEMGLQADERPFFAMKLVKGQTLTALLDQRSDPTEDRRNLLRVFEQVCQTMAYAHSRNVVHRDLKPSNVMVGAFGEVQVVDWGFAKVLKKGGIDDEKRAQRHAAEVPPVSIIETVRSAGAGTESLVGSVMGTPAYMPPEQAIGDVEHMDEMSDVFSLGAILTEILTGKPPYVKEGNDDQELIMKAARCQVEPVFERLEESESDPELVEIVKHCLQPERKQRPRNAGVLAAQIQDHLSRLQERAQQAQVRAARAEVRAQAEHKARNLTLGLAAAVLAAVLLGGAGLIWAEREHQGRVEIASRTARAAIEEASLLRGKAQVAAVEDLSGWAPAVAGIEHAVELAADADTATRERATELLVEFRREQAAATAAAATAKEDRLLVARLTDIRSRRRTTKLRESKDADYAALFAELDLDAAAIRGHRLREELVGALDDWGSRPKLVQAADPDPWRNEVRRLTIAGDRAGLLERARPANLTGLPAASLMLLATSLDHLYRQKLNQQKQMDRTISTARRSVLEAAYEQHPNDFWVSFGYGQTQTGLAAVRALSAALAGRPGNPSVRLCLGRTLAGIDPKQAFEVVRDLYAEAPDYRDVRQLLGRRYMERATTFLRRHRYQACIEANCKATELLPDSPVAFHNLGFGLSKLEHWKNAIAAMQEAIRLDPGQWLYYHRLGSFLKARDKKPEAALPAYRKAMELRLRHVSNVDKKFDAPFYLDYAKALEQTGDPQGALEVYQRLIPLDEFWRNAWHIAALHGQTKGMESAIAYCREVIRVHYLDRRSQDLLGHYLLASGAKAQAMAAFREELRLTEAAMQADPGNPGGLVDLAFDLANSENLQLRDPQRALVLIRKALAIYERLIKNRRVTIRNIDTVMEQRRARRILGYVLYRCGDYKAAIEAMMKDTRLFWCQVFLAMSHWQLGNRDEAKSWLQKAAAQESQSRGIQESLPCQRLLAEARALLKENR